MWCYASTVRTWSRFEECGSLFRFHFENPNRTSKKGEEERTNLTTTQKVSYTNIMTKYARGDSAGYRAMLAVYFLSA